MTVMDLEAYKRAYPGWLEANRHLLEAANWKEAMAGFPFAVNTESPWTPFTGDLKSRKLALLSTAGVYLPGEHKPFDAENIEGDWTYREIPVGTDLSRTALAHTHYPHTHADADRNSVFPLDRLRELSAAGTIGPLAPRHYSISGYCTRLERVVEEALPAIVAAMQEDGVEMVLHIPV